MQFDQTKYALTDEIPMLLSTAYDDYARKDEHPCSICREHPEQEGKRMHFHGSDFGACSRQVGFKMSTAKSDYTPRSYSVHPMFLKDGTVHEQTILDAFTVDSNFKVYQNKNVLEMKAGIAWINGAIPGIDVRAEVERFVLIERPKLLKEGWTIPNKRHFFILAHVDSLVTYTDPEDSKQIQFGIECKSVKEDTWRKLKEGWIDDRWYGQIQCYMFLSGIERWYLAVKNRTTSILHPPIRFNYDAKYVISRLRKLQQTYTMVNYAKQDRIPIPATFKSNTYECKNCSFAERCWNKSSNDLKGDSNA